MGRDKVLLEATQSDDIRTLKSYVVELEIPDVDILNDGDWRYRLLGEFDSELENFKRYDEIEEEEGEIERLVEQDYMIDAPRAIYHEGKVYVREHELDDEAYIETLLDKLPDVVKDELWRN